MRRVINKNVHGKRQLTTARSGINKVITLIRGYLLNESKAVQEACMFEMISRVIPKSKDDSMLLSLFSKRFFCICQIGTLYRARVNTPRLKVYHRKITLFKMKRVFIVKKVIKGRASKWRQ